MAAIEFVGLYLHDASDLDDFIVLRHATQPRSVDPRVSPIVYADGSLGASVVAGRPTTWTFDMPYPDDALLDALDGRLKRLQMLRSSRRQLRAYGFITGVSDVVLQGSGNTATITFAQTTFAEAT